MDALEPTTFNGPDRRDWPSAGSDRVDYTARVAFQSEWLRVRGLTRETMTLSHVQEEQRAWETAPKVAVHRAPSLDRTRYCEHAIEIGNCRRCADVARKAG